MSQNLEEFIRKNLVFTYTDGEVSSVIVKDSKLMFGLNTVYHKYGSGEVTDKTPEGVILWIKNQLQKLHNQDENFP